MVPISTSTTRLPLSLKSSNWNSNRLSLLQTSIKSNKRNSIYRNNLPEITETTDTLVVGSGLCGMSTAFYALKDKKDSMKIGGGHQQDKDYMQYDVLLCEAENRLGGNINTQRSMFMCYIYYKSSI